MPFRDKLNVICCQRERDQVCGLPGLLGVCDKIGTSHLFGDNGTKSATEAELQEFGESVRTHALFTFRLSF